MKDFPKGAVGGPPPMGRLFTGSIIYSKIATKCDDFRRSSVAIMGLYDLSASSKLYDIAAYYLELTIV